jgi:hypothetical protein
MSRFLMLFGCVAAVAACVPETGSESTSSSALTGVSDDVVLQWNEIAVQTGFTQAPFPGTRYMAAVQVAVFEAVNATTGKYTPYFGVTAPSGASSEAAAAQAARDVLVWLFPAATALDAQLATTLGAIPDGQARPMASRPAKQPPRE